MADDRVGKSRERGGPTSISRFPQCGQRNPTFTSPESVRVQYFWEVVLITTTQLQSLRLFLLLWTSWTSQRAAVVPLLSPARLSLKVPLNLTLGHDLLDFRTSHFYRS